jgi:hypothetical protein
MNLAGDLERRGYVVSSRTMLRWLFGELQRSLQRTSHDGWVNPNSDPLGNSSWQVQY